MCCKFSKLKKTFQAPLAPKLPVLTGCELVWVGGLGVGYGLLNSVLQAPMVYADQNNIRTQHLNSRL